MVVLSTEVSGSRSMRAKLTTLSGTFVQINFGETGGPDAAAVYFVGMMPPSSNAVVVRVSPGLAWASTLGGVANASANNALHTNKPEVLSILPLTLRSSKNLILSSCCRVEHGSSE